jgi:hypothetical protein
MVITVIMPLNADELLIYDMTVRDMEKYPDLRMSLRPKLNALRFCMKSKPKGMRPIDHENLMHYLKKKEVYEFELDSVEAALLGRLQGLYFHRYFRGHYNRT